jgi:hypothetical protein
MNLENLCKYAPADAIPLFEIARRLILQGDYAGASTTLESAAGDGRLPYQKDAAKLAKEFRHKAMTTGIYCK